MMSKKDEAISTERALKLALEALEESGILWKTKRAITALREALAEQPAQQGQVAWTLLLTGEHHGLVGKAGEKFVGHPEHYERVDVYTSPQRTWVGLTDEERKEALVSVDAETKRLPPGFRAFAEAIEDKLKEKNT